MSWWVLDYHRELTKNTGVLLLRNPSSVASQINDSFVMVKTVKLNCFNPKAVELNWQYYYGQFFKNGAFLLTRTFFSDGLAIPHIHTLNQQGLSVEDYVLGPCCCCCFFSSQATHFSFHRVEQQPVWFLFLLFLLLESQWPLSFILYIRGVFCWDHLCCPLVGPFSRNCFVSS